MKNGITCTLFALCLVLISCGTSLEDKQARLDSIGKTYKNPWTETQAELIVGKSVRFSEASAADRPNWYAHTTKFVSDSVDSLGQLSMLEFNFLEFVEVDSAKRSYILNKAYYKKEGRIEDISGLGDEAFFLTDDNHFYFTLVRKGSRELRIRLDFISPLNTKENFLQVAKEITDAM